MILDVENHLSLIIQGGKGQKGEMDFCLLNNNRCAWHLPSDELSWYPFVKLHSSPTSGLVVRSLGKWVSLPERHQIPTSVPH